MTLRAGLSGVLLWGALQALLGCGANTGGRGEPFDAAAPTGDATAPIGDAAPVGQWTWIDVGQSACEDGTPTGLAVNPGTGNDLLIYFEGGGACWDYATCYLINSATHGPFGRPQGEARATQLNVGPFDRTRAQNPFHASSYVYIPYCTGDLHGGTNVQAYTALLDTRLYHHVGRLNAQFFLERIRAKWPAPTRVVVSGTSAGGYGATLNYDLIRRAYPAAKMTLISDAGPVLEKEGINFSLRGAWFTNWHLGDTVNTLCPACRDDLSSLYTVLSKKYPADRMALLSALQDPIISVFFSLSLQQFESDLRATVHDRFDPTSNLRAYLVADTQHGYLPLTATTVSAGVKLETWLDTLVNGGAGWATVAP